MAETLGDAGPGSGPPGLGALPALARSMGRDGRISGLAPYVYRFRVDEPSRSACAGLLAGRPVGWAWPVDDGPGLLDLGGLAPRPQAPARVARISAPARSVRGGCRGPCAPSGGAQRCTGRRAPQPHRVLPLGDRVDDSGRRPVLHRPRPESGSQGPGFARKIKKSGPSKREPRSLPLGTGMRDEGCRAGRRIIKPRGLILGLNCGNLLRCVWMPKEHGETNP